MGLPIDPEDLPVGGDPGPVERILLASVRLACLPVLALVIVVASMVYGLAFLVRIAAHSVAGLRRVRIWTRGGDRPIEARDA